MRRRSGWFRKRMPNMSNTSRSGHSAPGQRSHTLSMYSAGSSTIPSVGIDGSR